VTQLEARDLRRVLAGTVVLVCPGGLEHGGGIGRQMGYFLRARQGASDGLAYQILDSRGPWFLGSSPFHAAFSVVYLARALLKLLAVRLHGRPCILHVNITGRGSTLRKIILTTFARTLGLHYLLHVHDADYAEEYRKSGAVIRSLITAIFRRADIVLVLGARDREALARLLQLPPDRIVILHNAVPDPQPDLTEDRHRGIPPHVLFLGHLSERKGVSELLRALASPALLSRHWHATLAGGGPIEQFRRLAGDLGIADRIEFPGWLDAAAVGALCADAGVLVLPSHAEALAMSVLEGLSYGLPVITTPVGAHPEVIESDVSGIFIPPGNVEALSDALVRVIDDEGLRQRLGAGARRRFLENFDARIYAARLGRLHAALLPHQRDLRAIAEEPIAR
jgi:glycosyltransferase involved in cell wall biosynthesis